VRDRIERTFVKGVWKALQVREIERERDLVVLVVLDSLNYSLKK